MLINLNDYLRCVRTCAKVDESIPGSQTRGAESNKRFFRLP